MSPWLLTAALLGGELIAPMDLPPDMAYGMEAVSSAPCLTDGQRQKIWTEIRRNVTALRGRGLLPTSFERPALGWPLKNQTPRGDPGVHASASFVDHLPSNPIPLDYACGYRAAPDQRGAEFLLFPFGLLKREREHVHVVAAAAGTIVGRWDGSPDEPCTNDPDWNAVYVQHADGSTAWYGHLKNGSVTSKGIGDSVAAGEYLGVVGRSGNAPLPRLHFELYDASSALVDPYEGPCNAADGGWWTSQRPYPDPAIVKLATHNNGPSYPSCAPEVPNFSNHFENGSVVFAAYHRDFIADHSTVYSVQRPDGTTWNTWSHSPSSTLTFYSYAMYWNMTLPSGVHGRWNFRAVYEGVTYDHAFHVLAPGDLIFEDGFQVGL